MHNINENDLRILFLQYKFFKVQLKNEVIKNAHIYNTHNLCLFKILYIFVVA